MLRSLLARNPQSSGIRIPPVSGFQTTSRVIKDESERAAHGTKLLVRMRGLEAPRHFWHMNLNMRVCQCRHIRRRWVKNLFSL
jgi:hypothetical protein